MHALTPSTIIVSRSGEKCLRADSASVRAVTNLNDNEHGRSQIEY